MKPGGDCITVGDLLSTRAVGEASRFVRTRGVLVSTGGAYAKAWEQWSEFHSVHRSTDLFLRSIEKNDMAKSMIWTMFCMHLYDVGKRAEQVYAVLSGVRHYLITHFVSVKFLSSEAVLNARRAVQRSSEEERANAELKRSKAKLPMNLDMLSNLRSHLWSEEEDWTYDAILKKAVWLACCLSYDRGPRIGNISMKSGKASLDHNIRCNSVSFLVGSGKAKRSIKAGPEMMRILPADVISVTIEIVSSKTTGGNKSLKILPAVITKQSSESAQLLSDLVSFVQHAGVEKDDPLLSFYRTSLITGIRQHKTITRKEISAEIKACALRCGLPAQFFSANSLRKGHATQTSMSGLSRMERNITGGWAPNSRVPDEHYDQSKRLHGALDAASNTQSRRISLEQLQAMVPAGGFL